MSHEQNTTGESANLAHIDVTCAYEQAAESGRQAATTRSWRFRNPHPRLSWVTWIILVALVVEGSYIYSRLFFLPLSSAQSGFVDVNGVTLPVKIGTYRIVRGRLNLEGSFTSRPDSLPETGVVARVLYGSPESLLDGVGSGLLLYANPVSETRDVSQYLIGTLESLGAREIVLGDAEAGKPMSAIGVLGDAEGGIALKTVGQSSEKSTASNSKPLYAAIAAAMPAGDSVYLLVSFADEKHAEQVMSLLSATLEKTFDR